MEVFVKRENWDGGIWMKLPASEEQAEQVMRNVEAVLEAAGMGTGNVLKTTCFLADMKDFGAFNEVYGRHFTSCPARSCVAVKGLPKGVLCEMEVIAHK